MIKLIILMAAVASTSVLANESEILDENARFEKHAITCERVEVISESVMEQRQAGVSLNIQLKALNDVLKGGYLDLGRIIAMNAHTEEYPLVSTQDYIDEVVSKFTNKWVSNCWERY